MFATTKGRTARHALRPLLVNAGEITHVQLALDGRWDVATRALIGSEEPAARLLSAVRARGECAVELFARDTSGCVTFLGVRFPDIAEGDAGALFDALFALPMSPPTTLWRVATWLSTRLRTRLFDQCRLAEIGVVDAWRSSGLQRIPLRAGDLIPPATAYAALLRAATRVNAPPSTVIAVEFAIDGPIPHWVAIELARVTPERIVVPSASAHDAAGAIADLARR